MQVISQQEVERYREPINEAEVLHISELWDRVVEQWRKNPKDVYGHPTTSWPVFNQAYGGIRPGEFISLTAETGQGKTTFALRLLLDMVNQGMPCLLMSFEERWGQMARKIAEMTTRKKMHTFDKCDVAGVSDVWKRIPLWFLDRHGMTSQAFVLKAMDLAARRKGVRFIVIDHLDYITKKAERWQSEAYVIGDSMRALVSKAHEVNAATLLIVHPKKLELKGTGRREVHMDELKGSSSIKQESDAVLSLYQYEPQKNGVMLRFQKIRDSKHAPSSGGFIRFSFDSDKTDFIENSLKLEWGSP